MIIIKMQTICYAIFFIIINNFCNNYCYGQNVTRKISEDSGTVLNNSTNGVSETQHARCQISTEELVANAETTVTRDLTGVCNAEVVDERFENLERMIKREIDDIKRTLNLIVGSMRKTIVVDVDPRQNEIDRLNNTVNTINTPTGAEKTFCYFIRVKDFDQRMSRWESGSLEYNYTLYLPPPSRYAMYVKIIPREIYGRRTYVKIGVGLTRGIHDETLDWPFILKYQIEILDHSDKDSRMDIRSLIINPLTTGTTINWRRPSIFGTGDNPEVTSMFIPSTTILNDDQPQSNSVRNIVKYLWNGDVVVKLTVYL